jgi:hypothetical protein
MKKISFKNIFKKSESGGSKTGKTLFILLIILIALGAFYWWGYPLLFPVTSVKSSVTTTTATVPSVTMVATKTETEPVVKEKTEFEIEMENRKKGYEEKIFVYEPYEPPSNRNPFEKVSTSYFFEETTRSEEEEGKEGSALRFIKPELPPGTKLNGIIGAKDKKIAMIEMNGEVFIANLYDILLDRYIVKEIKNDEVVIDYNGYFFSLKIGGEDLSDEL